MTEIGEKENMKNKVLASLLLLTLLCGIFGAAISFRPAAAEAQHYTLTVSTSPIHITTDPDSGVYTYDNTAWQNVTAPPEYIVGSTKYVFLNWTVAPLEDDYNVTACQMWVHVDQDKTAIAYYKTQYLFTMVTPYDTACIFDWSSLSWTTGASPYSLWFDADSVVRGGLTAYSIWLESYHWVVHTGWSGDATGAGGSDSNNITMNGAKTAYADWVHEYYLLTDTTGTYLPWDGGGAPYNPDHVGYYTSGTDVKLGPAPAVSNENYHHYQWRFDHWEVDNWNYTSGDWYLNYTATGENLTVHMDAAHRVKAFYWLQYYLDVEAHPPALSSAVQGQDNCQSGYYDYCTTRSLHAPPFLDDPSDPMHVKWKFQHWVIWGYYMWDDGKNDILLHINNTWADISNTLVAYYTREFNVTVALDPAGVPGSAIASPLLGTNWFVEGATCNCSALSFVGAGDGTRYRFDHWTFDGWNPGDNPHVFGVDQAYVAIAHYVLQYHWQTYTSPSSLLSHYNYENWADNDTFLTFVPPSGPISDWPFDWVLDYIKVNTATYTGGFASLHINEPLSVTAFYKGEPTFYVTPQANVYHVPAACTTDFKVNVTAANLVDFYATDFSLTWSTSLLQLTGIQVNVGLWKHPYWFNTTGAGTYHFVGTETGLGSVGYNGTWTLVTLTFHIIYDPGYQDVDYYEQCNLALTINSLVDSHGIGLSAATRISSYTIYAVKPTFTMTVNGQKTVTKWTAGDTFTVTISVANATRLHSWELLISYNPNKLTVTGAHLVDTFLTRTYAVELVDYSILGSIHFRVSQLGTDHTASGNGDLATISFAVTNPIIWTTAHPTITDTITMTRMIIDFLCPPPTIVYRDSNTWGETVFLWHDPIAYKYDPVPGDLNMDGHVNELDLGIIAHDYGMLAPPSTHDLIVNGHIDLYDLVAVAINIGRDHP